MHPLLEGERRRRMKTEINGIVVAGKVYEEVPEIDPGRRGGIYAAQSLPEAA